MERRERTRAALIAAATESFVREGYGATSLDTVLLAAGVSKGALYHHFASKADLLEAVFEAVSRATVAAASEAAAAERSPRRALSVSLKAWLAAVMDAQSRRVLLDVGPSVLGFARARALEARSSEPAMRALVARVVAQGEAMCVDQDLAVRLLNAVVTELAMTAVDRGLDRAGLSQLAWAIDTAIDAVLPAIDPDTGRSGHVRAEHG